MTSLRDFPLVGFRSRIDVENAWNVAPANEVDIRLNRAGRTVVHARTGTSAYLVHSGDGRSFKRLTPENGLAVSAEKAYLLHLDTDNSEAVRAEIHVLEYDAEGKRSGVTKIEPHRRALYLPSADVARVLLTLRVRGTAPLAVREFMLDEVPRPIGVHAGIRVVDYDEAAPEAQKRVDEDLAEFASSLESVVAAGHRARRVLTQVHDRLAAEAGTAPGPAEGGGSLEARRLARELLVHLASTLPQSDGSEYFVEKLPYHVAIVTDEYMLNFYRDVFERVTYVRPAEVDAAIAEDFDLLLYVTCWKGLENEEWRGVKFRELPREALDKLLAHAHANGKPTLFQSIEDPSNFEYFLPVAQRFDHVFTSDADCIEAYRRELGHDRVHYGEYGANQLLNNPIGSYRHTINKAFFAGSYPKRYQDRVDDMHVMFDSILSTGDKLALVDRNFGSDDYAFPPEYAKLSLEPMPHDVLQRVHKLFRWSLNFNSIKSSPTMCAMRIYELQAQGRGLLSNYARSVFNRFPEIRIVADHERLDSYFTDEIPLDELRNNESQVRSILTSRTAHDIASRMLADAGVRAAENDTAAPVVLVADRIDDALADQVAAQDYSDVRLMEARDVDPVRLVDEGVRYVGIVDTDHEYGPHYVTDRVNAFKYTRSAFVTQTAKIADGRIEGPAHEYADEPAEGVTLWSMRVLGEGGLRELLAGELPNGRRGYALPPFEARLRHSDALVERPVGAVDPALSIIVPVYNAGHYLTTKCIPSIDRNARADEFEILIVDDGSTDGVTPEICRELAARDPRVRVHCYETGGSGSASRPRNWGIDNARAPRIAFLDPDNEISDGGYDTLLALLDEAQAEDPAVGFVSGYQVKVTQRTGTTGRHTRERLTIRPDLRDTYFARGKFPVVSTQAAVMEKSLFADGRLRFVERAAGQDTLFGWELMLFAGHGAFTAAAHLIYYAERDGSVTNSVDSRYFEKKLIMEKAQVEALRNHGLLDSYRENHFENFLRNWYLPKLENVPAEERSRATEILRQIAELYGVEQTF